jgi:hypothetical protein
MPGYDRTGPKGAGARTGRGRGRCARPADEAASVEDPYQYYGVGWGYWPWGNGGGHQFRGGRQVPGRGGRRAAKAIQNSDDHDDTWRQQEPFLRLQMEALTAQLESVKELLSKYSPADGQNRE